MTSTPRDDGWKAGDLYEPYVGRWSRRVADAFLALDRRAVGRRLGAMSAAAPAR